MTQAYTPDWRDREYDDEPISDEDKVYEVQRLYRVVEIGTGKALTEASWDEVRIRNDAQALNDYYRKKGREKPLAKVQVADAEWRDT